MAQQKRLQFAVAEPIQISEVAIYGFDDTGLGQCRFPKSWRLLYPERLFYRENEQWKPVTNASDEQVAKDAWNRRTFQPVQATALRIDVQLQPEYSGGILEWQVK